MISASDAVMGVQRIKRDSVPVVMLKLAAPEVVNERDAREYYDVCHKYDIDTLFCLAMFAHESGMGKSGTARETHSWGNTRMPSFGVEPAKDGAGNPILITGRSGSFPKYTTWKDGLEATAARLTDPKWHYRGRTIGEVFLGTSADSSVWAPAGDLNDPNGYLGSVLSFMNTYTDTNDSTISTPTGTGGKMNKPTVVVTTSPNRGGYAGTRRVDAVVWHITQGTEPASRNWLSNPTSSASSNFVIERDGTIYQLVDPNESAWANGQVDKPNMSNPLIAKWVAEGVNFNQRTVSIEHEGFTSNNKGGSLSAAQVDATIRLTAWLCQTFSIAPDQNHILGHFEVDSINRPYCPGFSAAEWNEWVSRIAALVHGTATPTPGTGTGMNKSTLLKTTAGALPSFVLGLILYEATANLSEYGLASDAQCLVCEKLVLWTDGARVDAFHRGQYEALVSSGKVSEWK